MMPNSGLGIDDVAAVASGRNTGGNGAARCGAADVASVSTVSAASGEVWAELARSIRPFARLWARRDGCEGALAGGDAVAAERDAYEERAAILEYDAGMTRADAERAAAVMHPLGRPMQDVRRHQISQAISENPGGGCSHGRVR
jgi:hypothetical protein